MASQTFRVTKKDLLELLKSKDDSDIVGYVFGVQDGMDGSPHQVLVFYNPITEIM